MASQQRLLVAEVARRSLLLAALQESFRRDADGRLRFAVVRHHLRLHHSASYADLGDSDLRRACLELRIKCTRVAVIGVALRGPKWKRAAADWEGRLEAEGLAGEPPAIRRDVIDSDPADGLFPQPGMLVTGGDGVHRVVAEPESVQDLVDYHDPRSGVREARPRRWERYLRQLRAYLKTARTSARDREVLEMTAAGLSSIRIGRELKRHHSGVRAILARHHRLGGIKGPGPGR